MFIKRSAYIDIRGHLSHPEISLILGPRQAGKTTLLLKVKKELEEKGEKTIYFNLDRYDDFKFFNTQKNLLDKISFEFGDQKVYVFIDEIQRIKNSGLFLKGLFDYGSSHKFVITGSGSLEIKSNILEPLTGRKKIFSLLPLSFREFFEYKAGKSISQWSNLIRLDRNLAEKILNEYIVFGGYPKVVTANTREEKLSTLEEIYSSYLEKDIKPLIGVEKDIAYTRLLKLLAHEMGGIMKKTEISGEIGIDYKTLERYFFLLEQTFAIKLISPYFKNPRKELTKAPKMYFIDLGLRNFMISRFDDFWSREDKGALFENFVLRGLIDKKPIFGIYYWRSKSGAEVDFVLQENQILPVEVKSKKLKIGTFGKGLWSFAKKFNINSAVIVHLGKEQKLKKDSLEVVYKMGLI